jgi:hypothetical protein
MIKSGPFVGDILHNHRSIVFVVVVVVVVVVLLLLLVSNCIIFRR